MTRPSGAQKREIAELEDHAATLSRTIQILKKGLCNAGDRRTIDAVQAEIDYHIERLVEVRRRRDRLRQGCDPDG